MFDFEHSEPMHYWAFPATYSKSRKQQQLDDMINSGEYLYSLKTDGNWSRAIINPKGESKLQTRGISKKTGTYGEIQDRVLFWDSVVKAFSDYTVILGQVYLEGGVDRDVGSILRSLPDKAFKKQEKAPLRWRIFDVLCYEGKDIHEQPISERKKYLFEVLNKINNNMVGIVAYNEVNKSFYESLEKMFQAGEEGVVLYRKDGPYIPGSRTAHMTCKVKKELQNEVDVVCTGAVSPEMEYTGIDTHWPYEIGGVKVTKNFYYGWPGALRCSAWDEKGQKFVHVCDVSGISDEIKADFKDNPSKYILRPLKLNAMEITPDGSLRHPRFCGWRDDLNPMDCTIEKIVGVG